jgi:hypothetical protein
VQELKNQMLIRKTTQKALFLVKIQVRNHSNLEVNNNAGPNKSKIEQKPVSTSYLVN